MYMKLFCMNKIEPVHTLYISLSLLLPIALNQLYVSVVANMHPQASAVSSHASWL